MLVYIAALFFLGGFTAAVLYWGQYAKNVLHVRDWHLPSDGISTLANASKPWCSDAATTASAADPTANSATRPPWTRSAGRCRGGDSRGWGNESLAPQPLRWDWRNAPTSTLSPLARRIAESQAHSESNSNCDTPKPTVHFAMLNRG